MVGKVQSSEPPKVLLLDSPVSSCLIVNGSETPIRDKWLVQQETNRWESSPILLSQESGNWDSSMPGVEQMIKVNTKTWSLISRIPKLGKE